MDAHTEGLPDDIETLKLALVVAHAEVASVRAQHSDDQALIAHLKLQIESSTGDRYGPRSERAARLLDQLELQLAELEASATVDELAAEMARPRPPTCRRHSQAAVTPTLPGHLPRERMIVRDR